MFSAKLQRKHLVKMSIIGQSCVHDWTDGIQLNLI